MSFIKVTDPRKREELIRDFIETRKRIKDSFIAQKVGESEYQTGLTKLFKPVTETQKETTKEIIKAQKEATGKITSELKPIKEGVMELPLKLFNQVFPSIEFNERDITNLGPIAVDNLKRYFKKDGGDISTGIQDKNGSFYIGSEPVRIRDNNIFIDDTEYTGTSGLWKLITSKENPNKSEYTPEDLVNYSYIMMKTNTIHNNYNPRAGYRKGEGTKKYKNIIRPFVLELKNDNTDNKINFTTKVLRHFGHEFAIRGDDPQPGTSGTGLKILPSDPNALIDRFDLLFSSKEAGHTGVRNEIVSILDELKRQGVINDQEYKKLNSIIKK